MSWVCRTIGTLFLVEEDPYEVAEDVEYEGDAAGAE